MASNNTWPQDGHTKGDQSKDLEKNAEKGATGDSLGIAAAKKASQPRIEKDKANTESIVSSTFDMTKSLTQMKVTVPLVELLKIGEHREAAFYLFSSISHNNSSLPAGTKKDKEDQEQQILENYVGTTITQEPSQVDPFYVTMLINNRLIKNCMIDFGVAANVIPYGVIKELGLLVSTLYGKCNAMDNREVLVIGTMKDVEVKLAVFPEATYKMDVIVIDTKPHYGMLLSKQWEGMFNWTFHMQLSQLMEISLIFIEKYVHQRLLRKLTLIC